MAICREGIDPLLPSTALDDPVPETETVIRRRSECHRMSYATKVVLGMVGISAVIAAALVVGIILG